jgi:hypothetical protein
MIDLTKSKTLPPTVRMTDVIANVALKTLKINQVASHI